MSAAPESQGVLFEMQAAIDSGDYIISKNYPHPTPGRAVPVPGSPAFDKTNGRAGDIVVVQVRSGRGETHERRSALRTLGLRHPNSASLRFSSDPTTIGNIERVRDLVAVIALPEIEYKSDQKSGRRDSYIQVENYKYGTNSKPAHLWRTRSGEYFAYETSKRDVVTFWSSSLSLEALTSKLRDIQIRIDQDSPEAFVAVPELGVDNFEYLTPVDTSWSDITARGLDRSAVSACIPTVDGLQVNWRAPFQRFHDQERVVGSIGLVAPKTELLAIRSLARATGNTNLLNRGSCSIEYSFKGKKRTYQI